MIDLAKIEAQAEVAFAKAFPPPKRWRMVWGTFNGLPVRMRYPPKNRPYDALPPIPFGGQVVAGPICPSAEIAEQKAAEFLASRPKGWRARFKPVKPIPVNEDGTPLAQCSP